MFSGLIQEIGKISKIQQTPNGREFTIFAPQTAKNAVLGASVAHNGICLTITDIYEKEYAVWASPETLNITNCQFWQQGDSINCEASLKMGDEMGGHFVMGHVDCMGKIISVQKSESWGVEIAFPPQYENFFAPKGSVAVDGCSLTINQVWANKFSVMLIPHTLQHTNFHLLRENLQVNLEIDVFMRYAHQAIKGQANNHAKK